MLLKAGAEVDKKSNTSPEFHERWITPLDYAVREFHHRVYTLLLRAGADLPTAYQEKVFAEHKMLGGPYFARIAEAGGFPAYERLQRGKLIATATKMLGHRLPPSIIPTVVKFWGHPGEYAYPGPSLWNPGPVYY